MKINVPLAKNVLTQLTTNTSASAIDDAIEIKMRERASFGIKI